jgi:hypothetical protein
MSHQLQIEVENSYSHLHKPDGLKKEGRKQQKSFRLSCSRESIVFLHRMLKALV